MFTDDAKAVIALTTRLGSNRRPSLSPGKWHRLAAAMRGKGLSPAAVFDGDFSAADLPGMGPDIVAAVESLREDAAEAIFEADDLGRRGIWALTIADTEYPTQLRQRLDGAAPPVLFGVGNGELLAGHGIGIVGSRDVAEEGAEVAMSAAREAVRLGRPVVSGGARGVDQLAMNAAYQEGGSVVGVLADSLLASIRRRDVLSALDSGRTCLISQQSPSSGFSPGAAMNRNRVIYALAALTLVVTATEDSGGTWAGATEALRASNGTVAVWRGSSEGSGNAALARLGARGIARVEELEREVNTPDPTKQLNLY